jgi:peptidoglycan-N-acetylglucosamine deacetylase
VSARPITALATSRRAVVLVAAVLPAVVLLAAVLLPAPAAGAGDPAEGAPGLDIAAGSLGQQGLLAFRISAQEPWSPASLEPAGGLRLCLQLFRGDVASPRREVCVRSRSGAARMKLVSYALDGSGKVLSRAGVPATFTRGDKRSVLARFLPSDAGVRPGKWRWAVASQVTGEDCALPAQPPCEDRVPDEGDRSITVRTPRLKGCTPEGRSYRLHGTRGRKQIALTFDDGPGPYSSSMLRLLDRLGAKATFFVVGQQIVGRHGMLRRILHKGHELANHSWNHAVLAGGGGGAYSQIRRTNAAIRSWTGFTPCLFRAPYGAVDGSLVGAARRAGLATIQWDVDPRDWSTPGTGAIHARVVGAALGGSIVVMHDGGSYRGQTVQAVASIIRSLRARGYEFVTVSRMLGFKQVYR